MSATVGTLLLANAGQAQLHVPGDYATIQGAVDAAMDGETIIVAPGVYVEQVTILDKALTLIGEPGATIQAFPDMEVNVLQPSGTRAVLAANRSAVSISGFTFEGLGLSTLDAFKVGIYLAASDGDIRNCTFDGFRSEPFGEAFSRGVTGFSLREWGAPHRFVSVLGCTFTDCHDSILFGGDPTDGNLDRMTARIEGNTVVGQGPVTSEVQRGIWLGFGVGGDVRNNLVSDHIFLGEGGFSQAILAGETPSEEALMPRVTYRGNVLINNQSGIATIFSRNARIIGNLVLAGEYSFNGIAVSGNNNWVVANAVLMDESILPGNSGVALLGWEFGGPDGFGLASNTRVIGNLLSGADLPIWEMSGVTGTRAVGNIILP